jgi:hypothetical protein
MVTCSTLTGRERLAPGKKRPPDWMARTKARLTYAAKLAVSGILYGSGLLWLLRMWIVRNRAVVLTYHRVLTDDQRRSSWSHPGIVVSDRTFEMHLVTLSRWFTIVNVDELSAELTRGHPLRSGTCVVTFDDGWIDTYQTAWPLLR